MNLSRRAFLKRMLWTAGATGLAGVYPVWIEPRRVQVRRLQVAVPALPRAWDGLTIAHMTDLHRSPFVGLDYLNHCIETANALEPDITVFTGDYISHGVRLHTRLYPRDLDLGNTGEYLRECASCMARTRARYGVFASLGNHDNWYDGNRVTAALESAGIPVLRNRNTRVPVRGEELPIVGLGDLYTEGIQMARAFEGVGSGFSVVLMHNPDLFKFWAQPGQHLILAGHTHGGQINLPLIGAPVVPSKFVQGFFHRGDATMYVNRGLGMIFPAVRFNCPPEIGLIELKCA